MRGSLAGLKSNKTFAENKNASMFDAGVFICIRGSGQAALWAPSHITPFLLLLQPQK